MDYRIEKDTIGEVKVPSKRLCGPQTERSKNNFKIGELVPIKIIDAKGITLRGETININKMEAA